MDVFLLLVIMFHTDRDGLNVSTYTEQFINQGQCEQRIEVALKQAPPDTQMYASCVDFYVDVL